MRPGERLYAALLILYPVGFRRAFTSELLLLYRDLQRKAAGRGLRHQIAFWLWLLGDLLASALHERMRIMTRSYWAALISLLLCAPLLFMLISATFHYEPAFVNRIDVVIFNADGTPSLVGKIVMLAMLLSLPAAFLLNLAVMLRRAPAASVEPFRVTPLHVGVGGAILLGLLFLVQGQIAHELEPFVTPLGAAAPLARLGFLLLLALPSLALLLNRLPRLHRADVGSGLVFQPASLNLILAAALLLMILILLSALGLEVSACAIGVPNCD